MLIVGQQSRDKNVTLYQPPSLFNTSVPEELAQQDSMSLWRIKAASTSRKKPQECFQGTARSLEKKDRDEHISC